MTQELEVRKNTPLQEIRKTMESPEMREQIKMALPAHIPVEKFIRVVTTAVTNDPKLLSANRLSFYSACMKSAADGLIPDGKEAALVPFGEQVSYMPMVAGILKKIRNSGEIKTIDSQVVYKNDKFTYRPGLDEIPSFEPNWFENRGEAIGVYAVALTKDGGSYVEIMNREQIESIKKVARTKNVWDGPFAFEMWRKSAIRRLAKRLPSSTDLEHVVEQIDDEIDLEEPTPTPIAPVPETSSRLSAAVTRTTAPAPAPPVAAPPPVPPKAAPKPAPAPAPAPQEEPNEAPLSESEEDQLPI